MSRSVLDWDRQHISTLRYIITHVFCPLKLPNSDDYSIDDDHSLVKVIAATAPLYSDHVHQPNVPQWHSISRMLGNLQVFSQFESLDSISQFRSMDVGDTLALRIRAQNAGVIFRKQKYVTIFEAFELSPRANDVMTAEGKLICSYPGPAIEIPNLVFDDRNFLPELVNFLDHMNRDDLFHENEDQGSGFKDTVHPRYITELLTGILRGIGRPANIIRLSKRVGDDVMGDDKSKLPWRRSSLWLLIRVALQTTLDRSPLGHATYKEFMLFFMCCLVEERTCAKLPGDLLQFMSAKLSRRLRKLGSSAPDWLSRIVLQACTFLGSTIENRWRQVQVARVSPLWVPFQLHLVRDIHLLLLTGGNYLCNTITTSRSRNLNALNISFNPKHYRRGTLHDFLSSDGHFFEEAYRIEPHVALHDVERTVEQGVDVWVDQVTNNDEACEKLQFLADKYSTSALGTYANNPELLSVMLLTTIELWIALDKVTIKEIPMLVEYSPEVPTSILEHLLLCKTASLYRLRRAYEYLSLRHSQSRNQWSVFSSTATANSFAVRFYRGSSHLQLLKTRIEEVARREVREKVDELRELNARGSAGRIVIRVHEWPLPVNKHQAEAVVFELDCPISFNMWRTATVHLLVDLCSSSIQQPVPRFQLNQYDSLRRYLVKHPRSRISLGSNTCLSVFLRTLPAQEKDICVKNGMTLYPFDMRTGIPLPEALGNSDSRDHCTYKLESGPYQNLWKYVESTSHTSNEVVANQADCHKDLYIHEYMAFGHLRSGGLLQWLNILRELRGRSLNFRRHEVHMLLAQSVSQVGPLANSEWTWHHEIQQPIFCYALLAEFQSLILDVEANWLEAVTMDTISFLLRRLLASSPDEAISLEATRLLRIVRSKVFSWIQELSVSVLKTPGDERFRGILRDTAAICRSTFDVDPAAIPKVLHSAEDVDVLTFSAIIIHVYMPSDVSGLTAYSQLLLDRDRRLSLAVESTVNDIIQTDCSDQGINLAVGRIWPDYHPGSKWKPLGSPNSCWVSCKTAPPANQPPQVVHFNVLEGSLLVNGKPFESWLPNEVVQHPLYKVIFGEQVLSVIEGDLSGMDYSTRELISEHQVYLSLINKGSDLVIRAKRNWIHTSDSEIIELIPPEKLQRDLPAVLIEGHAHWLNLSTSIMEIRPLESLWEASSDNWRIDCTPGHYRGIWKGQESLVDIRSPTWDMVSTLLRPLATPGDIIVSVFPIDSNRRTSSLQLSVVLPRYDLSFYVDEDGDLQSRDFRGMIYDKNQSIGSLFGLVNQLVLRRKIKGVNTVELIPRCVLIPDGEVSFRTEGHHVRVQITTDRPVLNLKRVTYQTYTINTDLGCLTGNGSLTSKLYCAYLHALTGGCGIDPLTGRSGTEEALSILRSAGCWSTVNFSSRDAELLSLIASICPSRQWDHEKSVQNVEWRNLPANLQHHDLYTLAKAMKERYERLQLLLGGQSSPLFQMFPLQDDHLLKRIAHRAAYISPIDFSGKPQSRTNSDLRYAARDLMPNVQVASGEYLAYTAATQVNCRTATSSKKPVPVDIWRLLEWWTRTGRGKVPVDNALSLRYSRSWLVPDLPRIWLKAYDLLRESDERKWFRLLFSLPAMAYASSNRELVPLFVAFASHSQFRAEDPPHYDFYSFEMGCLPSLDTLRTYVVDCAYPFHRNLERFQKHAKPQEAFNKRRSSDANATAQKLLKAWPCETPPPGPFLLDPTLYDVQNLESRIREYISGCFRNLKLKEHLTRVQMILNELHSQASRSQAASSDTCLYSFQPSQTNHSSIAWRLTVHQLFARPAPPLQERDRLPNYAARADTGNTSFTDSAPGPLHHLIATVGSNAQNAFQRQYVSALRTSAESFDSSHSDHETMELPTTETLLEHHAGCRASYIEAFHQFQQHLGPRLHSELAVERSGQWPRITAYALFRCLASNSPIELPNAWKRCLIRFALLALHLQRVRRLLLLHFDKLHEEFCKELQNEGCEGWDAEVYPDWLLIQLQGNFLIRRVQAEVAKEMISPRSGDNTAMQLNMGEGKSSVIVPIAAAVLANGHQLVRVIVPKPLTAQTFHILADRLSGLTNRRIYYLPFSRSLKVNAQKGAALCQIMLECMKERGILVVQPEHVLSLKLVSVEKQLSRRAEDSQVARLSLKLQQWLHSHSRDILDESDEILAVRSQLTFTIGEQQHVEGSPERWTTTQQVLGLVSKHAPFLQELFPLGVEYEPGPPGSFPYLRILQADAGEKLISWITQDVIKGHLPNISFVQLRSGLSDAIQRFVSYEDVPSAMVQLVKECVGPTWSSLLLLRGLLANGILLFAFSERRWRVDYGLAPIRTTLAVPYRAKDVPAQRAEFGHPDVAIVLTCLSYYYAGLSEEQLSLSFRILDKQHDASSHYDLWVRACTALPEFLQTLSNVNIDSLEQWNKSLFPLFSRNRVTVNFYLSKVVFPKETKVFPLKLSSSGWDLAEKKVCLLTGFSGTNDSRHLLPLHITQRDPDHQRGTNAKVLSYLLQPENKHYMCVAHKNGERRSTREFLQILAGQKPEIRVLLDVGAQMLDLQNYELVKAWLDITPDASAAVYFSEDDELRVCTRDGNTQLLRWSSFAQRLDRCVVYLDDAHTRGTDIKFPSGFRAAVTLGPKVTKDRLVQGCMRMRKLGHGHSIMFFAPLDVDRHIRIVAGKDKRPLDVVDTTDILHWAIRETWGNIQRWASHWVQQGIDHSSRYNAWTNFCRDQLTSKELSGKWLQSATKTLEELYEPCSPPNPLSLASSDIRQRCVDLGILSLCSVGVDEEQERERELVYEVRRKREVERPSKVLPASHSIHQDVIDFVKTGIIPTRSRFFRARVKAFCPAFETLYSTSAATNEAYIWSQSVLVTTDFEKTVLEEPGMMDDYLRPVHWIVSAKRDTNDLLVILSPHEVNGLLPDIRSSKKVHLHLYTPRITKGMKPCDDLSLYSIPAVPDGWIPPSHFMDELSVFAGQLYFKDHDTYIRLCRFLCVYTRALPGEGGFIVEPDGFILPRNRRRLSGTQNIGHTFSSTPIVALKALMELRSKDVDFSSTHMGKLVHGHLLAEDDFDS